MCVNNKAFALKKQAPQRERNESTLLFFFMSGRCFDGLIHLCSSRANEGFNRLMSFAFVCLF